MDNAIAAAVIAGISGVLGSLTGFTGSLYLAHNETVQKQEEHLIKRRDERKAAYLQAINLVTDWQWRRASNDPNADRDFTIPFVRSGTAVRLYGSPASINVIIASPTFLESIGWRPTSTAAQTVAGAFRTVLKRS